MDRRTKYRHLLWWIICLDLLTVIWLGYRYLDRKIPDELYVTESQEQQVKNVLDYPLLSFDDAITVSGDGSYLLSSRILGVIPFKDVKVIPTDSTTVLVSGSTVGIYMETDGVLVIDTGEIISEEGRAEEPAEKIIEPGDYIVAFNDEIIETKKDLVEDLEKLKQDTVELQVIRKGKKIPLLLSPVKDIKGEYKLGIWVRDNTQGIGTMTYVKKDSFGGLGHGIYDMDTGTLLKIKGGFLLTPQIYSIKRGKSGTPGEIVGSIEYKEENIIGSIEKNTEKGIYGTVTDTGNKAYEIGYRQDIKKGKAYILSNLTGSMRQYEIKINKIVSSDTDVLKSMEIEVTDKRLLHLTNGIIQGMSGSPIIQDGKLIGAVTHVFVNDPAKGYAILMETMLYEMEK